MENPSNWTPSPPSDTIWYPQTQSPQQLPHSFISWNHQTEPCNKRWLDRPKATLCGLVLPYSNCYHYSKVLQTMILATTTHAMTHYPIPSSTTNTQMTKSRRGMSTMNPFNTNQRLWERERNLCWGWLNLDRGYCYVFTLLYFDFISFSLQLLNHLVPRTHGYTCSHHYDSFTSLSLTH